MQRIPRFLRVPVPGRGRFRRFCPAAGLAVWLVAGLAGPGHADPADGTGQSLPWLGDAPVPAGFEWWGAHLLTPDSEQVPVAARRPWLYFHATPWLRLRAEAGIDNLGGGVRAMVALELDF